MPPSEPPWFRPPRSPSRRCDPDTNRASPLARRAMASPPQDLVGSCRFLHQSWRSEAGDQTINHPLSRAAASLYPDALRLDPSRRALLLLLGCLLTALLFPAAFTEQRVGVGALLPATAPVTGSAGEGDPEAKWATAWAVRTREVLRLREEIAARPTRLSPSWSQLDVEAAEVADDPVRAVPARVLHRDVHRDRHSFLIDVGSDRDIRSRLAVVHGNSLVGVVKAVSSSAARVLRVDDESPDTVMPAMIVAAADGAALDETASVRGRGIVRGDGDGRLIVSRLGANAAVVGDVVMTDSGKFGIPDGLVLGEVVDFHDRDRNGEWEAIVAPFADLDTFVAVFVIVRPPLDGPVAPREGR